jgi:hypothetical protein
MRIKDGTALTTCCLLFFHGAVESDEFKQLENSMSLLAGKGKTMNTIEDERVIQSVSWGCL